MLGRQVLTGKPRVAAGQRTRRVTIEQRQASDTAGSSGFPTDTWTTLAVEYMSRLDVRADERFRASQLSAAMETQWHMGYRDDMDPEIVDVPKMRRLSYAGRSYDIMTAALIGEKQGIELVTLVSSKAP